MVFGGSHPGGSWIVGLTLGGMLASQAVASKMGSAFLAGPSTGLSAAAVRPTACFSSVATTFSGSLLHNSRSSGVHDVLGGICAARRGAGGNSGCGGVGLARPEHRIRWNQVGGASAVGWRSGSDGRLRVALLPCPTPSSPLGRAFAGAAYLRGGGDAGLDGDGGDGDSDDDDDSGEGVLASSAAVLAAVAALNRLTGGQTQRNRIFLDHVEDILGGIGRVLKVIGVPVFHLGRLGFGLALVFYGMAFRTFAFHVQVSWNKLASSYKKARASIREAALVAETVQRDRERKAAHAERFKAARERMIAEKHLLLANGRKLTKHDTVKFMRKHHKELMTIREEQAKFNSINSSLLSVKSSVDSGKAKSGLSSLYGALITSFTTSTYPSAGKLALALHVGTLLKTHILDLFGPLLDPIGYRLDLTAYYDEEEIPYMGNANAMDGPHNYMLNTFCYLVVFIVIRAHPRLALKMAMVYYGARVLTDYIVTGTEPIRRKLGLMPAVHTPGSAIIHAGLTVLGFCYHRETLHTAGVTGFHPLVVGKGPVGLVEPLVRLAVWASDVLHKIDFFTLHAILSHGNPEHWWEGWWRGR